MIFFRESIKRQGTIKAKGGHKVKMYRCKECPGCEMRMECTKTKYRSISRDEREGLMERMRARLETEEGKRIYGKRKYMVEPVFGDMKYNRKFGEFLLRGKLKATGEFISMSIAHNLRKIARYFNGRGFSPLFS